MLRKIFNVLTIVALMVGFVSVGPTAAMEDSGNDGGSPQNGQTETTPPLHPPSFPKYIKDQPNPKDFLRNQHRMQLIKDGKYAEADALGLSGTDRVLVILVEFAGTDTFTWTNGASDWDPLILLIQPRAPLEKRATAAISSPRLQHSPIPARCTTRSSARFPKPTALVNRSGPRISPRIGSQTSCSATAW